MLAARALHDAAASGNKLLVERALLPSTLFASTRAAALDAGETWDDAERYADLGTEGREAWQHIWFTQLTTGADGELIAGWRPYDGMVVADDNEGEVLVEIYVTPRDGAPDKRTIQWMLRETPEGWKAHGWARVLSKDEQRQQINASRGYEVVTREDGTRIKEADTRALGHLESTPQELREKIDELHATMIGDTGLMGTRAARDLVQIGKPAIPILLNDLHENAHVTQEDVIRGKIVTDALREITGKRFGYNPDLDPDSAFGSTDELRLSAVRQWFAWWASWEDRFEERREEEDALEALEAGNEDE